MRRLFSVGTLFALGMPVVSLALTFLLMVLGGLIAADLPQVGDRVERQALDQDAPARLRAERLQLDSRAQTLAKQVDDATLSRSAEGAGSLLSA